MLPPQADHHEFNNGSTATLPEPGSGNGSLVPTTPERPALPAVPWPATQPYGRPQGLTAAPSPLGLLAALRRRWLLATILGVLLAGGLAAIPWFALPVRHEVATWLTVDERPPHIMYKQLAGPEEFDRFKRAQAQLITTRFVLNVALRDPSVATLPMLPDADPVGFLQDNINIAYPGDSTVMRISMKGDDPQQLTTLVNAVREAYLEEIVDKQRRERLARLDELKRLLSENELAIENKQRRIDNLVATVGQPEAVLAQKAMLDRNELLAKLKAVQEHRERIRRLQVDMQIAKQAMENAQNTPPAVHESMVEKVLNQDPDYKRLQQEFAALSEQVREARRLRKRADDPQIQYLEEEQMRIEDELTHMRSMARERVASEMHAEAVTETTTAYNQLVLSHEATQQVYEQLVTEYEALAGKIDQTTQTSTDVLRWQEDLKELQGVTAEIRREINRLDVETKTPARVQEWQVATPEGDDRLMKYSIVGFSGLLGLLVAVFGVSLFEFQKRRIGGASDLVDSVGLNVIGSLPTLSGRGLSKRLRKAYGSVHGLVAESIDGIRSSLLHGERGQSRRVVMIASATSGEGKTTVATQLAASLARAGRRTLLVDADLRSPTAHRLFELPLEPGVSEVLRGEVELDDVIRPTRAAGLWMITAGQYCRDCLQALAKDESRTLFDKLRGDFDFVIIDSAPVLSGAEALSLGQHADTAVLAVLKNSSQAPKVYEACERLESVGVPIMGAVINGVTPVVPRHIRQLPGAKEAKKATVTASAEATEAADTETEA